MDNPVKNDAEKAEYIRLLNSHKWDFETNSRWWGGQQDPNAEWRRDFLIRAKIIELSRTVDPDLIVT